MDDRPESKPSYELEQDTRFPPPGGLSFPMVTWPELEDVIGPNGALSLTLPGYERRPGQEMMMRAVATALQRREVLLVEAGTGTGKSLAYLLPAVLSGEQVILSTGTKTLQDQLANKQVPFAREVLGIEFEAAVLKGRTNYLCLHRLELARQLPQLALDQRRELMLVSRWAETTETGDRAEMADLPDDSRLWRSVVTDAEECLGRRCRFFDECFVMRARQRADRADIVIVNHHLFFADLALRDKSGFGLLPDARSVVFDEAHRLEDIAATYFGMAVSDYRIRGLGFDVRRVLRACAIPMDGVDDTIDAMDRDVERLYGCYDALLPRGRVSAESIPEAATEAWHKLDNTLDALMLALGPASREEEAVARLVERAAALRETLGQLVTCSDPRYVYWADRGARAVFLRAAPIDVGPMLSNTLYAQFLSVVFTSATLTTAGTFAHIRGRLGVDDDALELSVASPFDYPNQALLYTPDDLPGPGAADFAARASERIETLLRLTDGRALVLFTSTRQMRRVYERLVRTLPYPVIVQGEGSRDALLARLADDEHSVLFATGTFWEGVDVTGTALSQVIIDKLPFAPPGDPLVDARIGALKRSGVNAFMRYQVPSAIIALKQGVGRLIRHRSDRGIVTILDPRLTTSRYGAAFLESLPPARRTGDLQKLRQWWLAGD